MRTSAFFANLNDKDLVDAGSKIFKNSSLEVDSLFSEIDVALSKDGDKMLFELRFRKTGKTASYNVTCRKYDESQNKSAKAGLPKVKDQQRFGPPPIPGEVELISRYDQRGSYEKTATYSFRFMTHDVEISRNNWDILFEARDDFKDHFVVNTVTDDDSFIFSLESGGGGCQSVNRCEVESKLQYAKQETGKGLQASPNFRQANVVNAQCYLVVSQDRSGRIEAIFEAKDWVKSQTVKIHRLEVISQDETRRAPRPTNCGGN